MSNTNNVGFAIFISALLLPVVFVLTTYFWADGIVDSLYTTTILCAGFWIFWAFTEGLFDMTTFDTKSKRDTSEDESE